MDDENDFSAIKVSVRVRPLSKKEAGGKLGWNCTRNTIHSNGDARTTKAKKFEFDNVFQPGSQAEVYARVASPLVKKAMQGFNGTVFAYGQTGSGKTWSTMGAKDGNEENDGIIPRSIDEVFAIIESSKDRNFSLKASYIEVRTSKIKLRHFLIGCVRRYTMSASTICSVTQQLLVSAVQERQAISGRTKICKLNRIQRTAFR